MASFIPSILARPSPAFLHEKTVCAVRNPCSRHMWVASLDGTSGNGVNLPSQPSLQHTALDATSAGNKPGDFDDELPDPYEVLSNARTVSVKLPLDAYLEESVSGQVFVDELVPGGNAEKSGVISAGDIIVAVSLPFGDGLFPVPKTDALRMVQEQVLTRDESEEYFNLAIIPSPGVEFLRKQLAEKAEREYSSLSKMQEQVSQIFIDEYPSIRVREPEYEELAGFDAEFLRGEGFDV